MKALSIIGIVTSFFSLMASIAVMDIRCYCNNYNSQPGSGMGTFLLVSSLFFLSFSIVATVSSFKRKGNGITEDEIKWLKEQKAKGNIL